MYRDFLNYSSLIIGQYLYCLDPSYFLILASRVASYCHILTASKMTHATSTLASIN